ncbi:MAG: hypothetical protein KatS3mg111_3012 [Pirellulaceae bacterium]|nr:MAG: hypothetical protein KatS3mg111_3012 [Pirellulaceae bacterium]
MAKWLRLFGKKRGSRMSGWWVVGSVGEAAFFGALFLLGVLSLTTVVTWQLFWPESGWLQPGVGFWLMVIVSTSFIVIGLSAFVYQVAQTVASPEMRSAMAIQVRREHARRATGMVDRAELASLPRLQHLTDSPGVKLKYRLPMQRGENVPLLLSALFTLAWNGMTAMLAVIALQGWLRGHPNWMLIAVFLLFTVVSAYGTRWFFRLFTRQSGSGKTAVEVDRMPLFPGDVVQVYLCQYGRVAFRSLHVDLVAFEEATYQQGTDIRTERREVARIPADMPPDWEARPLVADPENPLEVDCRIRLPSDIMHSFQSEHNALTWKIIVYGEAAKWPKFSRSFPVAVYPRSAV